MIQALFTLLIYILVLGVLWYLFDYLISAVPIPDPFAKVARILLVVIGCLILIALLLDIAGMGVGLRLPRMSRSGPIYDVPFLPGLPIFA